MPSHLEIQSRRAERPATGFSLLELLTSVLIITLLMGALFGFMYQAQKRLQGSHVISESNQTARAAMELMTQEIGQAGFNPQFTDTKTATAPVSPVIAAGPTNQCVTLNNITGINPGDWVVVDTGPNYEVVNVVATTNGAVTGKTQCALANQISGTFQMNHTGTSINLTSYKFPYPTGILEGQSVAYSGYGGTNVTVSNDRMLAFFGDINNDGTISYVVYSLYNPVNGQPPQSVTVNVAGTPQTFYLYNLFRSVTPLPFNGTPANNKASTLVENVLYQDITSAPVAPATTLVGPTNQPIFAYPNGVPVAITPSVITIAGTVVINLCVAINPKAMEAGTQIQYYTMATQIRPLNLWSAVTIGATGGTKYFAQLPVGLPMTFPSALSNYYY